MRNLWAWDGRRVAGPCVPDNRAVAAVRRAVRRALDGFPADVREQAPRQDRTDNVLWRFKDPKVRRYLLS